MTFKQIETEFDEKFPTLRYGHNVVFGENYGTLVKSFFKQSFIKYLQSEVDRCKTKALEFCGEYNDDKGIYSTAYLQALDDQIIHINNQIKELDTSNN